MTKADIIIGAIRTLKTGAILETIMVDISIIKVTEDALRKEAGHMTEKGTGTHITQEGLGKAKVKMDLEIQIGLVPGIEVWEGVIAAENQVIL